VVYLRQDVLGLTDLVGGLIVSGESMLLGESLVGSVTRRGFLCLFRVSWRVSQGSSVIATLRPLLREC